MNRGKKKNAGGEDVSETRNLLGLMLLKKYIFANNHAKMLKYFGISKFPKSTTEVRAPKTTGGKLQGKLLLY